MRYLDANVFIYAATLSSADSKMLASKRLLFEVAEGKLLAATSSLTWDEVVWAVKKSSGAAAAKKEGSTFLELANLKLLNVAEGTVQIAQKLVEECGLNPRDAIHAACAIENGIEEIVSDDSDFDDAVGIKRIPLGTVAKA